MANVYDLIDEARNYHESVQDGVERLRELNAQAAGLGALQIQKKAELAESAVSESIAVIEGMADVMAALIQGVAEVAGDE